MTFCVFKLASCIFRNVLRAGTALKKILKGKFLSMNCDFEFKKGQYCKIFSVCKVLLMLGCVMRPDSSIPPHVNQRGVLLTLARGSS